MCTYTDRRLKTEVLRVARRSIHCIFWGVRVKNKFEPRIVNFDFLNKHNTVVEQTTRPVLFMRRGVRGRSAIILSRDTCDVRLRVVGVPAGSSSPRAGIWEATVTVETKVTLQRIS